MNEKEQDILSIRLSTESFKYAVFNPFQENIPETMTWKTEPSISLTANFKKFLHDKEDLGGYQKVNVAIESSRYVAIPMELFDDEQAKLIFYHNLPEQENETILYYILHSINVVIIYSIDTSTYQLVLSKYPNAKFFVHICPFIEFFAARSHQGNNKKMYVNLRNDALDIICLDHGRLLLANSYNCRETDDRMYYLMYVWEHINFDQELDEMQIIGNIPEKDQLINKIDKFIRHRYILNNSIEAEIKLVWKCG